MRRWYVLAILCCLSSLLVPGIRSASTAAGAETRVWAFDPAGQVHVGVERSLTLDLHRGCAPTYDEIASDSLLAARGGASQMKKLSEGEIKALKDRGIDPHDLKPNSKFDLFKDKDGNIYVKPKDGSGPGEPTGINVGGGP